MLLILLVLTPLNVVMQSTVPMPTQLSLIFPEILKPLVFNLDPLIHNILLCQLAAFQNWVEVNTNGQFICVKLSHGDVMPTTCWVL